MKCKSIFISMLAAVATMFAFSACSSSEDPDSYYQWYLVPGNKVIVKTSQSSGLFEEWINNKIAEVEKANSGFGMYASDEEPMAKADQLSEALQQAVHDFNSAKFNIDFGVGECTIPYVVVLEKEGQQLKSYPSGTFTYKASSPRIIMEKPVTHADLNKSSQITYTIDDLKVEDGVTIKGYAPYHVYNDSDNTMIDNKELIKEFQFSNESFTFTFEDLSGKTGKYRILVPVVLQKSDQTKQYTVCIYLDLN